MLQLDRHGLKCPSSPTASGAGGHPKFREVGRGWGRVAAPWRSSRPWAPSECPAHTVAAELIPLGGLACGNVISDWSYMGGFQILTSLRASGWHGQEARGGKQIMLEQDEKQGSKSTRLWKLCRWELTR